MSDTSYDQQMRFSADLHELHQLAGKIYLAAQRIPQPSIEQQIIDDMHPAVWNKIFAPWPQPHLQED